MIQIWQTWRHEALMQHTDEIVTIELYLYNYSFATESVFRKHTIELSSRLAMRSFSGSTKYGSVQEMSLASTEQPGRMMSGPVQFRFRSYTKWSSLYCFSC